MATIFDVAKYVLELCRKAAMLPITTWKLQKLVYYSQAWSLVWDDKLLFGARIEAWANGPVVPQLYRLHRGTFRVSAWPDGDPSKLDNTERETIDAVLKTYADKSS